MTQIELSVSKLNYKFISFYLDESNNGTESVRKAIRDLVIMNAESGKSRIGPAVAPMKLQLCVRERDSRVGVDMRKEVYIPDEKMLLLNRFVENLFKMELLNTVQAYIDNKARMKDGIQAVFDKYGIDGEDDFKMDRALKMVQRAVKNGVLMR